MKSALALSFIVSALIISCNKAPEADGQGGSEAPARLLIPPPEDAGADVPIIGSVPDAAPVDAAPPPPTCLGQPIECCQTQYWYCPEGFTEDSLWRMETVVNICDESGEPCEPQYGDESCIWQIVSQSECSEVFTCNPVGDPDLGTQPCAIEGEDGEIVHGEQAIWCNKGHKGFGPCVPCLDEICDGIDNDCDGTTDEGQYPCSTECGDGLGMCIEGEIAFCDAPTSSPEICDDLDNDCDGLVDEELVQACETICEPGIQICISGDWSNCTAQPPLDEVCDGMDNDCDGQTDEGLNCQCPPETVGMLVPCMEDPLVCGQGFKSCQCVDNDCTQTEMSSCLAMCSWLPPDPNQECDPFLGIVMAEVCNNFDENCNELIDEDLVSDCYTGPDGTVDVGICTSGQMVCHQGTWGAMDDNGGFLADICSGEQVPLEEDLCTGTDDNCDGVIEKEMEETDILFIVDTSGSMSGTINAVQTALQMFSAHYADQEVIQWGLIVGPVDADDEEMLLLATNLVPFAQFLPVLAQVDEDQTGDEMLYDALFLAIRNLSGLPGFPMFWEDEILSSPQIPQFLVNWREDANHVVVVFSDEEGQSYLSPNAITQDIILEHANAAENLSIYTFSKPQDQLGNDGWGPLTVSGDWNAIISNAAIMFGHLMDILDEEACGGDGEEEQQQGAALVPIPGLWDTPSRGGFVTVSHTERLVFGGLLYSESALMCLPRTPR